MGKFQAIFCKMHEPTGGELDLIWTRAPWIEGDDHAAPACIHTLNDAHLVARSKAQGYNRNIVFADGSWETS